MSLFGTLRFYPICQRCLSDMFAEDSDEVGGGVEMQLGGNIADGERGVA